MTDLITGKVRTTEVRGAHRIDEKALAKYLEATLNNFSGNMEVRQFPIGQSNPTYKLIAREKNYVLRKKPPGKLLPSAHAVDREYRIISALADSGVPVPSVFHLCQDESVIGTEFFIMEMVEGRVFHNPGLPDLPPADRTIFFENFIRILAKLHTIDIESIGLKDFGRPHGYLPRQVNRWSEQYQASMTEDIPSMDCLIDWLPANLPCDQSVSIVHGDYRPGNIIVAPDTPLIVAVLDWELSTLGHPLADLGYCCANYHGDISTMGNFSNLDHKALGIPLEQQLLDWYCNCTGRSNIEDYYYYVAFSLFRSAAIIQGVYKRGLEGNASSERAVEFKGVARERADVAWALIEAHF